MRAILKQSKYFWAVSSFIGAIIICALLLDLNPEGVANFFKLMADSPFAIPITIGLYVAAAFIAAPQWMLHGGAVLTFGPMLGSGVAWCATMISASINFGLGRAIGAEQLEQRSGAVLSRLIGAIRRYGFWTALAIRVVPSGPFVLVNMAAGAAKMTWLAFVSGTAIGIIPKIVTIAFFGEGIRGLSADKGWLYMAVFVGIAVIWLFIMRAAKSRLAMDAKTPEKKDPPRQ